MTAAVDALEADVRARATRLAAQAATAAAAMLERSAGDVDVYVLVLAAQEMVEKQKELNRARVEQGGRASAD